MPGVLSPTLAKPPYSKCLKMFHSKTKVGYRGFNISNKESLEWNLWNTKLFETIWVFWGIINKAKWNSSTAVFTNMLITLCFTQTRIPALVINRNFSMSEYSLFLRWRKKKSSCARYIPMPQAFEGWCGGLSLSGGYM